MSKLARGLRRIWRVIRFPLALIGVILIVPLIFIVFSCGPFAPVAIQDNPGRAARLAEIWAANEAQVRPEAQTYLTFPEWYVVFSADEYAEYVIEHRPSSYPFFQTITQFWQGYAHVCHMTTGKYAFNQSYHLMLYVVGISFSIENGVKGIYEGTVGRLTEWISSPALSEEDAFARQYAKEYGDFIHAIPWFDFPFAEKFQALWSTTSLWGPNPIRKWERKLALSTDLLVKAGYGVVVGSGSEITFGPVVDEYIYTIAEGVTEELLAEFPNVALIEQVDDTRSLITIPRYEPFTELVPALAQRGVRFIEFSGNDQIGLSAFAPRAWTNNLPEAELMFAMNVLIDPTLQRIGLNIPVAELHTVLAEMDVQGITIEHIYDY